MPMTLDKLKAAVKKLHRIQRFTSYTMLKPKSVLEHCARVAIIYEYLGGKEVFAALMHDLPEAFLGFDPPSPIKAKIPAIKEFERLDEHCVKFQDEAEEKLCKLADGMELLLDLKEQQQLGNQTPELLDVHDEVLQEVMDRANALGKKSEVKKLLKELTK